MQAVLKRITVMILTTAVLFTVVLGAISSAALRRQQMWQAMRDEHRRRLQADQVRKAERKARARLFERTDRQGLNY
jgi:hypothetical protein